MLLMKLELFLISNKKKTKVTFFPIIEIEGATQHQKMTMVGKNVTLVFLLEIRSS